jgi:tetratricopeptide (TPR) repeat protein
MASLIPGFEYDIFISYRQKDNKYDGWVTEFVENLKKELEATLKEEVSVYFDINPHDGLLETHDVDASLKEKLKCLIFIPIISRTYCDPKSFAWEHEFKAFIGQASHDQFGLKVKLPNGNVANRILPVRIHDLDPPDIILCESVLGGIMRGVEFIYKEPGVNRSLTPADDDAKNLNRTRYRNQINKVALAIREILLGLQAGTLETENKDPLQRISFGEVWKEEKQAVREKPARLSRVKLISVPALFVILAITAIIVYPKIFKKDNPVSPGSTDKRTSIVVLPFQNMTNDTIWNVWQDGIQNELINSLTNYEELKVRQAESINEVLKGEGLKNYASITPSLADVIANKLDARLFLYGSIKQAGAVLRVNAQLSDTKNEETIKSFSIECPAKEEMIFQTIDSLSKQVRNFLIIVELKKNLDPSETYYVSTKSPIAYRYYTYGLVAFYKSDFTTAIKWYSLALAVDSNFISAASNLSWAYRNLDMTDKAKEWCLKIYKKREMLSTVEKLYADFTYSTFYETPHESIKYLTQIQEIDDRLNMHFLIGTRYIQLLQYEKAITELEKCIDIYEKRGESLIPMDFTTLGFAYHGAGQYKKESKLYKKAEKIFPDDPDIISNQAILSITLGDTVAANKYIDKYVSICKNKSETDINIISALGWIYYRAGNMNKAENYFRQALSMQPEDAFKLGLFAWFLIDKDRNVNEGLELNEKALASGLPYYNYLGNKGWGLYKQGRLKESLDTLEKAWSLRTEFNEDLYRYLQEVRTAVAGRI